MRQVIVLLSFLLVINVMSGTLAYPTGLEGEEYDPAEIDSLLEILQAPEKRRSFCKTRRFSWNPVLRRCVPNLSAFRGRSGRRS